jgi:hypothetical protein
MFTSLLNGKNVLLPECLLHELSVIGVLKVYGPEEAKLVQS